MSFKNLELTAVDPTEMRCFARVKLQTSSEASSLSSQMDLASEPDFD